MNKICSLLESTVKKKEKKKDFLHNIIKILSFAVVLLILQVFCTTFQMFWFDFFGNKTWKIFNQFASILFLGNETLEQKAQHVIKLTVKDKALTM